MKQRADNVLVAYATYESSIEGIYYGNGSVFGGNGDGKPINVSLVVNSNYPWLAFIVEEIIALTGCKPIALENENNLYPEYLL